VSLSDVNLMLAELHDDHPHVLNGPLLGALLGAAARLDNDGMRLIDVRHEQTTDLLLSEEHAQPFREWLKRAVLRSSVRR
jgi:hypothetical protein